MLNSLKSITLRRNCVSWPFEVQSGSVHQERGARSERSRSYNSGFWIWQTHMPRQTFRSGLTLDHVCLYLDSIHHLQGSGRERDGDNTRCSRQPWTYQVCALSCTPIKVLKLTMSSPSHPKPFQCKIRSRSNMHAEMVAAAAG